MVGMFTSLLEPQLRQELRRFPAALWVLCILPALLASTPAWAIATRGGA